jgi:hypothetical protein
MGADRVQRHPSSGDIPQRQQFTEGSSHG